MNLVKKTVFFLCIFFAILALILCILVKSINPEAVKNLLNYELTLLTSQKSRIDGTVRWQFFPSPGIKITNIQMGENNAAYSLMVENLSFNLQLTPLLRGKLVFRELNVDGFTLRINALDKSLNEPNLLPDATLAQPTRMTDGTQAEFAIEKVLLARGKIIAVSPAGQLLLTGLQIGATQLNLHNEFFPLQLKANLVATTAAHKFESNFNFKGKMGLSPHQFSNFLNMVLEGQLIGQNVQFDQLKINKINANLRLKEDRLTLNPLNLSLYEAESVGDLSLQIASKKITVNQTATSLNANHLVNDFFGNNLLKGSLDFSIHATAHLQQAHWQNNFQGNGNISIKDGVLYFFDLPKFISSNTNKIHTLLANGNYPTHFPAAMLHPLEYQSGQTKFQLFSMQYRLVNNMLLNDSLLLQTNLLQLQGKGEINLIDYTIEQSLSAKLITSDPVIEKAQQLLHGSFPLKLSGKLNKPTLSPNIQKINPLILQTFLKKSLVKPVKKIKNQLKSLLEELS